MQMIYVLKTFISKTNEKKINNHFNIMEFGMKIQFY